MLSTTFFAPLCFFVGDFTVLNVAAVVPKCCLVFVSTRRRYCAMWRKYTLDKLFSGPSHNAADCEFGVHDVQR